MKDDEESSTPKELDTFVLLTKDSRGGWSSGAVGLKTRPYGQQE